MMEQEITFGAIVKERRYQLGLSQAELARHPSCAAITIRKIEANALHPSVQIAEQLAIAQGVVFCQWISIRFRFWYLFLRLGQPDGTEEMDV